MTSETSNSLIGQWPENVTFDRSCFRAATATEKSGDSPILGSSFHANALSHSECPAMMLLRLKYLHAKGCVAVV